MSSLADGVLWEAEPTSVQLIVREAASEGASSAALVGLNTLEGGQMAASRAVSTAYAAARPGCAQSLACLAVQFGGGDHDVHDALAIMDRCVAAGLSFCTVCPTPFWFRVLSPPCSTRTCLIIQWLPLPLYKCTSHIECMTFKPRAFSNMLYLATAMQSAESTCFKGELAVASQIQALPMQFWARVDAKNVKSGLGHGSV